MKSEQVRPTNSRWSGASEEKKLRLTQSYIKACENELGEIPQFRCDDPAGVDLPVYVDGSKVTNLTSVLEKCDNPTIANFNGRCAVGSRYVKKEIDGVIWGLFCINVKPKKASFADGKHFDNIAIIGWRSEDAKAPPTIAMGQTCFFSSRNVEAHGLNEREPIDGSSLPKIHSAIGSLNDIAVLSDVYDMQKDVCVNCHQAGPWLRTPRFSHGMGFKGTKESILDIRGSSSDDPYSVVGREILNSVYTEMKNLDPSSVQKAESPEPWTPQYWDIPESNANHAYNCVKCHRLGRRAFGPENESPHLVLSNVGGPYWMDKKRKIVVDPAITASASMPPLNLWHVQFSIFKSVKNAFETDRAKFDSHWLVQGGQAVRECILSNRVGGDCGDVVRGDIFPSKWKGRPSLD